MTNDENFYEHEIKKMVNILFLSIQILYVQIMMSFV